MAIDDDYLTYPRRAYGMDHDRYDWSVLFKRKPVAWPGSARVALWITPSLEWFPLDMDNKPFRPPGGLERPYPDYRYYTHRDYGNRVGVFRIMKLLDRLRLKASVAINAHLAERHPFLLSEIARRDWEVVAHGLDMAHLHWEGLSAEAEMKQIDEALRILRTSSGQPVTGWLSPAKSESSRTLDLIAAQGVDYVCDWPNDDMPYPMRTQQGALWSMPHSEEINDRTILLQYHHSEAQFAQQIKDQFDTLMKESETQGGRIMALVLHPWIIGVPYRMRALSDALEYIAGHEHVWSATGSEILCAWRRQQ